jgi:hypothetical protein
MYPPVAAMGRAALRPLPSLRAAAARPFGTRAAPCAARAPTLAPAAAPRLLRAPVLAMRRLSTAGAMPEPTGPLRFVPLRVRQFTLKYGFNFVAIYLGVYWLTLLGIYSIITVGIVGARDMMGYIESGVNRVGGLVGVPLADWLHISDINPDAAPLVAAWMLAKPTEPPRLLVSAAITPTLSKWFTALRSTQVNGQRAVKCAPPLRARAPYLARVLLRPASLISTPESAPAAAPPPPAAPGSF